MHLFCNRAQKERAPVRGRITSHKNLAAALLLGFLWTAHAAPAWGQDKEEGGGGEDGRFVNLGLISFSKDYTLGENNRFIVFTIRNNSNRPISQMYAWIYSYTENPQGEPAEFRLVNNPHKGGSIVKGKPHTPGSKADWRFPLVDQRVKEEPNRKFTLRVSPQSIFYPRLPATGRTRQDPQN